MGKRKLNFGEVVTGERITKESRVTLSETSQSIPYHESTHAVPDILEKLIRNNGERERQTEKERKEREKKGTQPFLVPQLGPSVEV